MKRKLFLLLTMLLGKSLFADVCVFCKEKHFKEYICLPKTHRYFLNGEVTPLIGECYIYHICHFFELREVNSLDKCGIISKIFYKYYQFQGDIRKIDISDPDPLIVEIILFLNNFVKTEDEMILFHVAMWHYSKQVVNVN